MTPVDSEKKLLWVTITERGAISVPGCSIAALGAGVVAAQNQPLPQGRDVFPFHHKLI